MALTNLLDTCSADKLDAYLFTLCLDINYNGWEGHAETFDSIMWGEVTPPIKSVFDSKLATLTAEYNALAYARNRATAYPSLADQADMQYWDQVNGTTTWKDAIAKVKSDNPKE